MKPIVAVGVYAAESEVFRDGVRALMARWLHDQVGTAYDALKTDPSRAVSPDRVRARIAAEHNAMANKEK